MVAQILANLLIAAGLTVPVQVTHDWVPFAKVDGNTIYIDSDSLLGRQTDAGLETWAQVKLDMIKPVPVEGKKKAGAYFINDVRAVCAEDKLVIERSSLYAKDGEVIASGELGKELTNSHKPRTFSYEYLKLMCNNVHNGVPDLNV